MLNIHEVIISNHENIMQRQRTPVEQTPFIDSVVRQELSDIVKACKEDEENKNKE